MAYSKKIIITLLFALGILLLMNSNVFAYSFVGKDGQLVTTASEPQYAESPLRLITYYDGYYYFMCPNVPNQSGWYWYTDQNGQLSNSFTADNTISAGMYCVRIAEGDDYGWSSDNVAYGEIPQTLFYENITFNASPIYDHYGSSLIIKPSMVNESQNGMQQGIEALMISISPNKMWGVFFIMIPIVAIACLFAFGIAILHAYLTLPQKSSYEEFLEKYGFEDKTDEEYEEAERQLYFENPEFLEENDDLPPEYYDEREDDDF